MATAAVPTGTTNIPTTLRAPEPSDGSAVHALVRESEYLDENSLYCYLLICTHFSATSVIAEQPAPVIAEQPASVVAEQPESGDARQPAPTGEEAGSRDRARDTGENRLVGFISAYIPPQSPSTLFVWQVGVSARARRQGIAGKMLREILSREHCSHITHLETTVTADNAASRRLFQSLRESLGCPLEESVMFDRETHFNGRHDTEYLLRIGPFDLAGPLEQTGK